MTDHYPFKFNVSTLEHAKVFDYLATIPSYRYTIARRQMVGELTLREWRIVREAALALGATKLNDGDKITSREQIEALLATDSDAKVDVTVFGLPTTTTRRLLNRVAIQVGLNEAGVALEDQSLMFTRGTEGYLIQFSNPDDARAFKLAMWSISEPASG